MLEFSEHGYAGARISAIAARAGVNQQLISYYFDGKAGLYRALSRRWEGISATLGPPDSDLADVVVNFLRSTVDHRPWARLLAWEGLTGGVEGGTAAGDDDSGDRFFAAMVSDARRRQDAGQLDAELDPRYTLLVLFAAAAAPALLPQVARRITGQPPESPEFIDGYGAQLRQIVDRLRSPR